MNNDLVHIGGVVYRWGCLEQSHLMKEAWLPFVQDLEKVGSVKRVLFDRFDTRGPHVFFVLTIHRDDFQIVSEQLADRLKNFIAEHPDSTKLTEHQLAAHHAGCRGKIQCEVDRLSGFGVRDSVHLFEHPNDGYPFYLTRGVQHSSAIWNEMSRLSLWACGQLQTTGNGIAALPPLGLLLALDREVRERGWAIDFWRHYATTLLIDLSERLAQGEEEVVADLPRMIGEDNLVRLAKVWAAVDRLPRPDNLGQLVDLAVPREPPEGRSKFYLLREVGHLVLKQIGLPVPRHVPPILFAWLKAATDAADGVTVDS